MRDKTSPLATIYPSDFVEDFNGKQWTWQDQHHTCSMLCFAVIIP